MLMQSGFRYILAVLMFPSVLAARPSILTIVTTEKHSNNIALETIRAFTHEFAVRLKHLSATEAVCEKYETLARQYVPLAGQTMLLLVTDNNYRPVCHESGNGNIFIVQAYPASQQKQVYKYGRISYAPQTDVTEDLNKLINVIKGETLVSSESNMYYDTPENAETEEMPGIPIPGYVILTISLIVVLISSIMVKTCAAYQKEKPIKGVFDKSPIQRRPAQSEQRESDESKNAPNPPSKPTTATDEKDKLRSEPWKEICKHVSKETWEEFALVIANRRGSEEVLDVPVTSQEFLFYLHRLSRIAIEYHSDPTAFSVTTDSNPGFLYRTMPRFAPENPDSFASICKDLRKKILPGMTHWHHPRFHGYFLSGRPYPDILAEVVTSAMAFNIFSWESCPSLNELEYVVVNWIGRAFGLPEAFLFQENPQNSPGGGSIYGSASDAIFCSVLVSRQWKINQVKEEQKREKGRKYETVYDIGKKLVVYCSKDAHSGIEKACKVAMVRCRPIEPLQENKWGITGSQLEKHILKDIESGLIPTHFHCTLGTSATAADDDLASIFPVAEKYGLWIHCDASYSGNAWIDEKYRENASALAHAHSVNVNLHKSLLFSGMSCLLWTRDRQTYKEAFTTHGFRIPTLQDIADIREWGIHTSRRNKALKIWMSLRLNGLEGLRFHLNNAVEMCAYFESLVATHPLLKIYSRKLTLLTFYYVEPGCTREESNSYTENLCQFINTSHKLFLTHTKVHDNELIRLSITYERTNRAVIEESWRILKSLVDEFTNRKNDPYLLHTKMVAPTPRRRLQQPASVDYAQLAAFTRTTKPPEPPKTSSGQG